MFYKGCGVVFFGLQICMAAYSQSGSGGYQYQNPYEYKPEQSYGGGGQSYGPQQSGNSYGNSYEQPPNNYYNEPQKPAGSSYEQPGYEQQSGPYEQPAYGKPDYSYKPPENNYYGGYEPPKEEYPKPPEHEPYVPEHKEEYVEPETEPPTTHEPEYNNPDHPKESKIVSINTENAKIRLSRYPEPAYTECVDVEAQKSDGAKFADVTICFDPDLSEAGISLCCPPEQEHINQYGHYYPPPYEPYDYYGAKPAMYSGKPGYAPGHLEKRAADIDLRYVQPGNDATCRQIREVEAIKDIPLFAFSAFKTDPFPASDIENQQQVILDKMYFDDQSIWKNTFGVAYQGALAIVRHWTMYQGSTFYFSAAVRDYELPDEIFWDDAGKNAHINVRLGLVRSQSCDTIGCSGSANDENPTYVTMSLHFEFANACSPFTLPEDQLISQVTAKFEDKNDLIIFLGFFTSYNWLNELAPEEVEAQDDTPIRLFCAVATGTLDEEITELTCDECIESSDYKECSAGERQYGGDFKKCVKAVQEDQAARCGTTSQALSGDNTACRIWWLDAVALTWGGMDRGASCEMLGEHSPGCPVFVPEGYEPNHDYEPAPVHKPEPYKLTTPIYGGPYDSYKPPQQGYSPNPGYYPDNSFGYSPYKRAGPPSYGNYGSQGYGGGGGYGYNPYSHGPEKKEAPPLEQHACPCLAYESRVTFFNNSHCGQEGTYSKGFGDQWDMMEMVDHFALDECCEVEETNFQSWRHVSCNGKHGYTADLYKDAHCKIPQLKKAKTQKKKEEYNPYGSYDPYTSYDPYYAGAAAEHKGGGGDAAQSAAPQATQDSYDVSFEVCEVFEGTHVTRYVDFPTVHGYRYFPCEDRGPFGFLVPVTYIFKTEHGQFAFDQLTSVKPLIEREPNQYDISTYDAEGEKPDAAKRSSHPVGNSGGGGGSGGGGSSGGGSKAGRDWKGKYVLLEGAPRGSKSNFIQYFGKGKYANLNGRAETAGFSSYEEEQLLVYLEFDNYHPREGEYQIGEYTQGEKEHPGYYSAPYEKPKYPEKPPHKEPVKPYKEPMKPPHKEPEPQYHEGKCPDEFPFCFIGSAECCDDGNWACPNGATMESGCHQKDGCYDKCGRASTENGKECFCDPTCLLYNDCCENFCDECRGDYGEACSKHVLMDKIETYPERPRQGVNYQAVASIGGVSLAIGAILILVRMKRNRKTNAAK